MFWFIWRTSKYRPNFAFPQMIRNRVVNLRLDQLGRPEFSSGLSRAVTAKISSGPAQATRLGPKIYNPGQEFRASSLYVYIQNWHCDTEPLYHGKL